MIESLEIAQAVAEATARHCTDVVMSPGSRNSPLAYALIARDDITVHMRIDERSAAFTALGIARVQRRHVAVVMTSGTNWACRRWGCTRPMWLGLPRSTTPP